MSVPEPDKLVSDLLQIYNLVAMDLRYLRNDVWSPGCEFAFVTVHLLVMKV